MRPAPIMLRLGQEEWRIRPLTLWQIQEIEPLLRSADQNAGQSISAAIAIIAIALMRDHKDAADRLHEIEAGASEIARAMGDVLRLGGFIAGDAAADAMETAPGEAPAGADWISTSSTPA